MSTLGLELDKLELRVRNLERKLAELEINTRPALTVKDAKALTVKQTVDPGKVDGYAVLDEDGFRSVTKEEFVAWRLKAEEGLKEENN